MINNKNNFDLEGFKKFNEEYYLCNTSTLEELLIRIGRFIGVSREKLPKIPKRVAKNYWEGGKEKGLAILQAMVETKTVHKRNEPILNLLLEVAETYEFGIKIEDSKNGTLGTRTISGQSARNMVDYDYYGTVFYK